MPAKIVIGHAALSLVRDAVSTVGDGWSRIVVTTMGHSSSRRPAPAAHSVVKQHEGDDMTLLGRIKIGMAWKGWDQDEFERQLRTKRPNLHRQTLNKWFTEEVESLRPTFLFLVSEVLDCNPRWLALREGEPHKQPELGLEQLKAIQIYNALKKNQKALDKWLREGGEYIEMLGETSVAQPFQKIGRASCRERVKV